MSPTWETLVEHLRAELAGYGGLLQLFADQRDNLLRGDADAVLAYAREIEAQTRVAADLRARREAAVATYARAHQQPAESTLRALLPFFPEEVRPLLTALIGEINHLIYRVGRGARQTQGMLGRIVEVHHESLRALQPEAFVRTYAPTGQFSSVSPFPPAATLRATG
jgi:hypothetical protein